jgi:hypothetical protein
LASSFLKASTDLAILSPAVFLMSAMVCAMG